MGLSTDALTDRIIPILRAIGVAEPPEGFPTTGAALVEFLREELLLAEDRFRRGGFVRIIRRLRARFRRSAYRLSRENAQAFHYFLEEVMTPPPGGFAWTIEGLRYQLMEFARSAEQRIREVDELGFQRSPL